MRELTRPYTTDEERRQRQRGEARDPAKKWQAGDASAAERNFTTPGDRESPRSYVQDLGDLGEDMSK